MLAGKCRGGLPSRPNLGNAVSKPMLPGKYGLELPSRPNPAVSWPMLPGKCKGGMPLRPTLATPGASHCSPASGYPEIRGPRFCSMP